MGLEPNEQMGDGQGADPGGLVRTLQFIPVVMEATEGLRAASDN